MSRIYLKAYQWLLRGVVELLDIFPPKRIDSREFSLRKGVLPDDFVASKEGCIWIHGASLGEVITLRPFLKLMADTYGRERIFCTSTTIDGLNQLKKDAICGYATLMPVELPAFTVPFIEKIKPKLMLISETEIWPLLLTTLKRKKVPYAIINGRINEKTVRLMKIAWALFENAVEGIKCVLVQEKQYLRRYKILGVASEKLRISGSFKYDFIDTTPDTAELREKIGLSDNRKLICFGSTHPDEEEIILDALEPLWKNMSATVVIAPRHVKRVSQIESMLQKRSIDYSKYSQVNGIARQVLLVDTMGELRNIYAASDLAYVGGSLVEHGGHNLMEPARYSVPIVSGPHTFNFRYEMMALKKANAISVARNCKELNALLTDWISNPEKYIKKGKRANHLLNEMAGASIKTLRELQKIGLLE